MTAQQTSHESACDCVCTSIRESDTPLVIEHCGVVDYRTMWKHQADLAHSRAEGLRADTLLLLEHPSVYTAGKRTQPSDLPRNGLECIPIDRGGRITWHGPGQLVGYPIIKLADPVDVVDYVRRLEEGLIRAIHELGLTSAGRITGRSGVWVPADDRGPERKIAALGIRVTRGVTMHGFALNCSNTLEYYNHIVPCGISDAGVSTLSAELARTVTVEEAAPIVTHWVTCALDGAIAISDHTIGKAEDPCSPAAIRRISHVNYPASATTTKNDKLV